MWRWKYLSLKSILSGCKEENECGEHAEFRPNIITHYRQKKITAVAEICSMIDKVWPVMMMFTLIFSYFRRWTQTRVNMNQNLRRWKLSNNQHRNKTFTVCHWDTISVVVFSWSVHQIKCLLLEQFLRRKTRMSDSQLCSVFRVRVMFVS